MLVAEQFSKENNISLTVRRSTKARRLQIVYKNTVFEVVAPLWVKDSTIVDFIATQQAWINKQSQKKPNTQAPLFLPTHFLPHEVLYFQGNPLVLQVKYGHTTHVQKTPDALIITLSWHTPTTTLAHTLKTQTLAWYQQQALLAIKECLDHFCPLLGRWPSRYQVKLQKTRWGSCGIHDGITINWLLILAPREVLTYVVVHELCHLFHRNHSKRFWAKVAHCFPEYKTHAQWLKTYGTYLKLS